MYIRGWGGWEGGNDGWKERWIHIFSLLFSSTISKIMWFLMFINFVTIIRSEIKNKIYNLPVEHSLGRVTMHIKRSK